MESPYGWMLCSALAFSTMGALAHALGERCSWPLIAFTRAGLALVFAGSLAKYSQVSFVFWRPATLWMRSISGSISLICTFFAITHLPVADALTLTNMFPLWVAVLSWPLLRQKPTMGVWLAVVSGIVGVGLMQQPHFEQDAWTNRLATLAAVFASFTSALAMIGLHHLRELDARAVVVHFSLVGTVVSAGIFLVVPLNPLTLVPFTPLTIVMLLAMGATATLGQITMTRAYSLAPPARVAVVGLTQVAFGIGYDFWLWHRTLNILTLVGITLIVGPTCWVMMTSLPSAEKAPIPPSKHQDVAV